MANSQDDDGVLSHLFELQNPGLICAKISFCFGVITLWFYANLRKTLGHRFLQTSRLIMFETLRTLLLMFYNDSHRTTSGIVFCVGNSITLITFLFAVLIVYDLRLVVLKQHWTAKGYKRMVLIFIFLPLIDLTYSTSIYFSRLKIRNDIHANLLYASLLNVIAIIIAYLCVFGFVYSIRNRVYHEKTGVEYLDKKHDKLAKRMNTVLLFPLSLLLTSGVRLVILLIATSIGKTIPEIPWLAHAYVVGYVLFSIEGILMSIIFFSFETVRHKIRYGYIHFWKLPSKKEKVVFIFERLACGLVGYSDLKKERKECSTTGTNKVELVYGAGLKSTLDQRLEDKNEKKKRRNSNIDVESMNHVQTKENVTQNPVLENKAETKHSKLHSIDLGNDTSTDYNKIDSTKSEDISEEEMVKNKQEEEQVFDADLEEILNREEEFHFGFSMRSSTKYISDTDIQEVYV